MDANPDHRQLYLRLFTDSQTVRHYLNLKLAISTDEKLQANAERALGTVMGGQHIKENVHSGRS